MPDEQAKDMPQTTATQEVDRIRDIIFGPQMRHYEQQFQTIQRDLDRLQQEMDHLTQQLADQDSSQIKKLQSLRKEMREADDDLRGELRQVSQALAAEKVDRTTLGELFIELGAHLKTGGSLVDLADLMKSLGTKG